MTMEAMSKLAFLSNQSFKYYIFQGTEYDWNPFLETWNNKSYEYFNSKQKKLNQNIEQQISELLRMNAKSLLKTSEINYLRLQDFIQKKINQYIAWNKKWF
ncbi:hypothetical protein ACFLQ5_00025 [Bacteroidota bacterium]